MDNLTKHTCNSPLNWHNCYDKDSRYAKYFTPESNAHPAKMSWGLAERIFKHLKQLNLLKPNSTIIDFMAGTGRTNVMATLHGHRSIAIELEPHFCKMITDNKAQLEKVKMKDCDIEIIQADARNMSEILTEGGAGIVSPPYSNHQATRYDKYAPKENPNFKGRKAWMAGEQDGHYSPDPTNIGNLPDKPLVGVVSPPYAESISTETDADRRLERLEREGYLDTKDWQRPGTIKTPGRSACFSKTKYSSNPNNIGNLKDTPLVGITSPPYESTDNMFHDIEWMNKVRPRPSNPKIISEIENNIERDRGKSYLQAMRTVYQEAYNSGISPLVVVTKNPTRNGELRRLDLDTVNLLQLAGYKIIDYHRAILFKERNQMTLDGNMKKIAKGRLSFFKRLSYDKGGKVARWEDVIFAQKEEFIWKQ